MSKIFIKLYFLIAFLIIIIPQARSDASGVVLYISPSTESYYVGKVFNATLFITSLGEPINTIEGTLIFSRNTLELINVSKAGSVMNIWLSGPTFSNKDGRVDFSGGIPTPGFKGSGGIVLNLTFRAVADGPASITWERSTVLANDGKGTEIVATTEDANHIINRLTGTGGGKEIFSPESSTFYIVIGTIIGVILLTFFISKTWFTKKSIREGLEHLDKDIREDLTDLEKELENNTEKSKIFQDFRNMRESIEKDIDNIEKKI